jgi:hypothetical protein
MTEWLMPSLRKARKLRDAGEALDLRMSRYVQDRLNRQEDTSSFHAALLQREKEGKSDMSAFERDTLSGVFLLILLVALSNSI